MLRPALEDRLAKIAEGHKDRLDSAKSGLLEEHATKRAASV